MSSYISNMCPPWSNDSIGRDISSPLSREAEAAMHMRQQEIKLQQQKNHQVLYGEYNPVTNMIIRPGLHSALGVGGGGTYTGVTTTPASKKVLLLTTRRKK